MSLLFSAVTVLTRAYSNGTLSAAAGSGYSYPHNLVTPLEAIGRRAFDNLATVRYVLNNTAIPEAQAIAREADVTLVFVCKHL